MPFTARGVASPWFTGRAQKPAGGGVWILDGPKLLINSFVVVNSYMLFPALSADAVSRLLAPQDSSHSSKVLKSRY